MKLGPKDRSRRRALHLTKLGFSDNDLWIAASALERNAVVVSEDPDFQRMAALESFEVENWLS
jgi:tRNA(fMet)-specific endonuclease VapC